MLYFDAEKMDRVFMNLFSNAFKYTEPGGTITVNMIDDDRTCYIEFEDTGSGIPPENLDIIFDRFGQAHAGPHRRNEGTGIGLSLVRELVQLHGGTISVESVYAGDNPEATEPCSPSCSPRAKDTGIIPESSSWNPARKRQGDASGSARRNLGS